jgi:hypothetical protein
MKKPFIALTIAIIVNLMGSYAFAISYCLDFLEGGNPGGMTTGFKTCDAVNPVAVAAGDTFAVDVWVKDLPEGLLSSGFMMEYTIPASCESRTCKPMMVWTLPVPGMVTLPLRVPMFPGRDHT